MLGGKGGIGIGRVNFSCCVVLLPHCLFLPSNRKKKRFLKRRLQVLHFYWEKNLGGRETRRELLHIFSELTLLLKTFSHWIQAFVVGRTRLEDSRCFGHTRFSITLT